MATTPSVRAGAGVVLALLASGQFVMTLDSSVMNVSMATVASDLGTTISGIQTAITCRSTRSPASRPCATHSGSRRCSQLGRSSSPAASRAAPPVRTTAMTPHVTRTTRRTRRTTQARIASRSTNHRRIWHREGRRIDGSK